MHQSTNQTFSIMLRSFTLLCTCGLALMHFNTPYLIGIVLLGGLGLLMAISFKLIDFRQLFELAEKR